MFVHEPPTAAAAVFVCRHECRQLCDFDYAVMNREGQLEECVNKLCSAITYMLLLLPLCSGAGMNAALIMSW
jgi:hypothetical protein